MQVLPNLQRKASKTVTFVIGFTILFWVQNAIASATLDGMRIGQDSNKTRVVFDIEKTAQTSKTPNYTIIRLNNPSRLVIDFHKTANALGFKKKHITDKYLFIVRSSENKAGSRVVLDLHKNPYFKSFVIPAKKGSAKQNHRLVVDFLPKPTVQTVAETKTKTPVAAKLKMPAKAVNSAKVVNTPKKPLADKNALTARQQALLDEIKAGLAIERARLEKERLAAIEKAEKSNNSAQTRSTQNNINQNPNKPNGSILNQDVSKTVKATKVAKPEESIKQPATTLTEKHNQQTPVKLTAVDVKKLQVVKTPKNQPVNDALKANKPSNSSESAKTVKAIVDITKTQNKPLIDTAPKTIINRESAALKKPAELVIAVDAGHGGKDNGATGPNNTHEKHATLMIAKELKKQIDRQPGMRAVLTRDKDVFIKLAQRVKFAKKHQADLFISIHADAFHDKSVRGGSVYVLSKRGASSTMAKLLAKSENARLDEIKLKELDQDVAFALSDLSKDANIKASQNLAKTVLKQMRKKVKMHKSSVQSATFTVLRSIDMPSLLIETAFISNPHEAKNLMSKKFQRKMASAITDGLVHYAKQMAPKKRWGDSLYVHYKVQSGDTLSEIAKAYDVTTGALKKINNIKNANTLYVGKKLKIPVAEKFLAGTSS